MFKGFLVADGFQGFKSHKKIIRLLVKAGLDVPNFLYVGHISKPKEDRPIDRIVNEYDF